MSKKILTLDNVPVINKKIGKIDTIEKLKASTIYSLGDVVEVLGFYTKGDGAHHYRQKVDEAYTGGDAIDCADGTKWKILHNGEVNVSWFGVKLNDESYDNHHHLKQALSIGGYTIKFDRAGICYIKLQVPNNRLLVKSNTKIIFESDFILKGMSTTSHVHDFFKCENVVNVEFIDVKIDGSKDLVEAVGESGHAITIYGSDNIRVLNPIIRNMFGDGIAIGGLFRSDGRITPSRNVYIDNFYIEGCRRLGISLVCWDNIFINNGTIKDIKGTEPQCGIDIEPNPNYLWDKASVKISNLKTINCASVGIVIGLKALRMQDSGNNFEGLIDIDIDNHTDYNSKNGLDIQNANHTDAHIINGKIKYSNCSHYNVKGMGLALRNTVNNPLITINNYYLNGYGWEGAAPNATYGSGISIGYIDGEVSAGIIPLGNVHIINPTLIQSSYRESYYIKCSPHNNSVPMQNVIIDNPKYGYIRVPSNPFLNIRGGLGVEYYLNGIGTTKDYTTTTSLSSNQNVDTITNKGALTSISLGIASNLFANGNIVTFISYEQSLVLSFANAPVLLYNSGVSVVNKTITLTKNSKLKLKKVADDTYEILEYSITNTSLSTQLDTPYYALKMQREEIYDDYVAYRDELHEYENIITTEDATMLPVLQEPVIPESVRTFAEKYKLI